MTTASTAAMTESDRPSKKIVIEQRVRDELAKHGEFKLSSDALDVLNEGVSNLIKTAAHRCKENGRVTIQPQDF